MAMLYNNLRWPRWAWLVLMVFGCASGAWAQAFDVNIVSPTNGQVYPTIPPSIAIEATVSNAPGGVAYVEFIVGSSVIGAVTNPPYVFAWTNVYAGTHRLRARAYTVEGASQPSGSVLIQVFQNQPPTAAITSPANGAWLGLGSNLVITAEANDPEGAVSVVYFYLGDEMVGSLENPPYQWAVSNLVLGAYVLTAVAEDNWGVRGTSGPVRVEMIVPDAGIVEDFERGPSVGAWSGFAGPLGTDVLATNFGGAVSGTNALWFGGDDERYAATRPLALRAGAMVEFWLRISGGNGGNWNLAELPDEGVVFEYANDGGEWQELLVFDTPAYTNWQRVSLAVPVGALGTNTVLRWRQPLHSGEGYSHWALDDVLVTPGPAKPTILTQPKAVIASEGATASFLVAVRGTEPFAYQWRANGINLPGATNPALTISNLTVSMSGLAISVVVTNAYGSVTSAVVALTVGKAESDLFRIVAFGTNGATIVDHDSLTSDDRGGIAVSSNLVFISGDSYTARFSAANLTGGTRLNQTFGQVYDGLVSNLRTETVYTFSTNGVTPFTTTTYNASGILTSLLEMNATNGALTGNRIMLSSPINIVANYYKAGVFSGSDRIVLLDNNYNPRAYHIALPSGMVTDLGTMPYLSRNDSEAWAYWGVVECFSNSLYLVYAGAYDNTIYRTRLPDGETTVLQRFSNLGEMASFTVSFSRQRWYFHYEYSAQFGGSSSGETLGSLPVTLAFDTTAAPAVLLPPRDVYAVQGDIARIGVVDAGALPRTYQWLYNGEPLPGANSSLLVISNVQAVHEGQYQAVIANYSGSITSAPARLIVGHAPVIQVQPTNLVTHANSNATFVVVADGTAPLDYQWYRQYQGWDQFYSIYSATNASYSIDYAQTYDESSYYVVVTNAFGVVTSKVATLTVLSPPNFSTYPADTGVLPGASATLTAYATGTEPISYRWYKEGVLVSGGSSETLTLATVGRSELGGYTCVASNAYGVTTSVVAQVTFVQPPVLPALNIVVTGDAAVFSVPAAGTKLFSFQWVKDGAWLPGETAASLVVPYVDESQLGLYSVVLSNSYGVTTSQTARLTFLQMIPNTFRITGLLTNNSKTLDHNELTGDDRGGIAASRDHVFYSGDNRTARFSLKDLTGGTSSLYSNTPYDTLVSNLRTETVYAFSDGTRIINGSGYRITALEELNGATLAPTGRRIQLSQAFTNNSGMVLSGFNRVGYWDSNYRYYYDIALPSGQVTRYGPAPYEASINYYSSENWAAWGVVEYFEGSLYMVYVQQSWQAPNPQIIRTHVGDWTNSVVADFTNLGDMASFTVSIPQGRWYFHHESGSEFYPNGGEIIGYADAGLLFVDGTNQPPAIARKPTDTMVPVGTSGRLEVLSWGTQPLNYQWQLNGVSVAGATNRILTVNNMGREKAGYYSVVVTNVYGAVTSTPSLLSVDFGTVTNRVPLFGITNIWKYNQGGVDLGTTWSQTNYSDAAWPAGRGLLALEDNGAITPYINTPLSLTNGSGTRINTHYFRSWLALPAFTGNLGVKLVSSNLVDDGAVFYLNGTEQDRLRITTGITVSYSTPANVTAPEALYSVVPFPNSAPLAGASNLLAVEVHQNTSSSSDVVFGMGLFADVVYPNDPPYITSTPATLMVNQSQPFSISVSAASVLPMTYQWWLNSTRLAFTQPTINVASAQTFQAGEYRVVVSNAVGVVTTVVAQVTVVTPPGIAQGPQSQELDLGSRLSLSVTGTGSPLYYQWRQNGQAVSGMTNAQLVVNTTTPAHAGVYDVLVWNPMGSLTSLVAQVKFRGAVVPPPALVLNHRALRLRFNAPAGVVYQVEASEDLRQWLVLGVVTNLTGTVEFLDYGAGKRVFRFYRLRAGP